MSEMMTTYLPSILLMMITFATTFFKPLLIEAALSVNLTTMLVMTTIFISKMEGLPPTSDIKMIDIWLIFCQIYPFFEVVLLTAMEYNRQDQDNDTENIETILVREVPSNGEEKLEIDDSKKLQFCTREVLRKYLPRLKTLGLLASHFFIVILIESVSEGRVLPSMVLISFIAYFAAAIMFYNGFY